MDKLIIDSATRIIRGVTSDDLPTLNPNEIAVEMPSKVILPNTGKGFGSKLDLDNLTIVSTTKAEQDAYQDIIEPKRVVLRDMLSACDAISLDPTDTKSLGTMAQKLKELFS